MFGRFDLKADLTAAVVCHLDDSATLKHGSPKPAPDQQSLG